MITSFMMVKLLLVEILKMRLDKLLFSILRTAKLEPVMVPINKDAVLSVLAKAPNKKPESAP